MNAMMNENHNKTDNQPSAKPHVLNRLRCATLEGVDATVVEVEATFTKGLPGFAVVGLASSDIQEAKERVKSALLINDFTFPPLRITIGLSPSEVRKSGSHFDLAIALLVALHERQIAHDELFVFGEVGLDGRIKSSFQIFPLILSLKERGLLRQAMVPKEAMAYLKPISGVDFIPVATLNEAIAVLSQEKLEASTHRFDYDAKSLTIEGTPYYYRTEYPVDFADVKGQRVAKRAALIAAAGMHNLFMEGNPGCGKSMIASRLRYILPPMSEEEMLAVAKHRFLDGEIPDFKPVRPFRHPHHTATSASIFGGGSSTARIGEVALAHRGLLFFDEIPHFSKQVLEALREPLQDRRVHISRVNAKLTYASDVMFVAAQNPCPCGNLLSKSKTCRCNEAEIKRYRNKLSDPLLDRIDLFVTMQEISGEDRSDVTSEAMHRQVIAAFVRQKERGQTVLNGKLDEEGIERFCALDDDAQAVLDKAVARFALSHRAIASIKKVARTVADLEGHDTIQKSDMLEALSYRRRS